MLVLLIGGYALLVFAEYMPLYKQENRRDFWVNAGIGAVTFGTALLLCLHIRPPSPAKPIRQVIMALFGGS